MESKHIRRNQELKKIYTRKGDAGTTNLLQGKRISKHHLRVEANGIIDELSSWIGYVRAIDTEKIVESPMARLQSRLITLCSDIVAPFDPQSKTDKIPRVPKSWSRELEEEMDVLSEELSKISQPILPGGSPIGASLHLARTVCRRAELMLVHLQKEESSINPEAIRFVNRLSDYLFMMARWANRRGGIDD